MIKYDASKLAPLLCCEQKWHPIYMLMSVMDNEQLFQFRKDLRSYTPYHYLHRTLELAFRERLEND
jgi:hypothetical protein